MAWFWFYVMKIRYLSTIGGSTVMECTRRILRHMFTDRFAMNLNWKGRGGKIAMCDMGVHSVIISYYKLGIFGFFSHGYGSPQQLQMLKMFFFSGRGKSLSLAFRWGNCMTSRNIFEVAKLSLVHRLIIADFFLFYSATGNCMWRIDSGIVWSITSTAVFNSRCEYFKEKLSSGLIPNITVTTCALVWQ